MVSNALNIDYTFVNKKLISLCNRKTNGIGFHNIHYLSYTAVILRLKAYGSYGRFVMQSIPHYLISSALHDHRLVAYSTCSAHPRYKSSIMYHTVPYGRVEEYSRESPSSERESTEDAIYSGSNNWLLVQINGNWFKLISLNLKIKK